MDKKIGAKLDKAEKQPITVDLGVKFAQDWGGVKFRAMAKLPGEDYQNTVILADVLPFINLGDNWAIPIAVSVSF